LQIFGKNAIDKVRRSLTAKILSRTKLMLEQYRGVDRLQAIELRQLRKYLQHKGWYEDRLIADFTSVWVLPSDSQTPYQLMLPLKREVPGFAISMQMVLDILEIVEGRSSADVLDELLACEIGVKVCGTITHVEPESNGISVSIVGVASNRFCKVNATFDLIQTASVLKAYQLRSTICCTGDLVNSETHWVLKNARDLSVTSR
jgi:hypothetical protein